MSNSQVEACSEYLRALAIPAEPSNAINADRPVQVLGDPGTSGERGWWGCLARVDGRGCRRYLWCR
jgi:hypothetical protein